MLRTIMVGTTVLVQGFFIRELDDGRIQIRVGSKTYSGLPVWSLHKHLPAFKHQFGHHNFPRIPSQCVVECFIGIFFTPTQDCWDLAFHKFSIRVSQVLRFRNAGKTSAPGEVFKQSAQILLDANATFGSAVISPYSHQKRKISWKVAAIGIFPNARLDD